MTGSGGATPTAFGLIKVGAGDTEVLLPMSTLKPVSTYAAVNTYTVYVVAEAGVVVRRSSVVVSVHTPLLTHGFRRKASDSFGACGDVDPFVDP